MLLQVIVNPSGHLIRHTEHRGHTCPQKLRKQFIAVCALPVSITHKIRIITNVIFVQRSLIAQKPFSCMEIIRPSADYPNVSMPHRNQIPGHLISAPLIIQYHRRYFPRRLAGIGHYCRNRKILRKTSDISFMTRHINDSVRLALPDLLKRRTQNGSVSLLIFIPGITPPGIHPEVLHRRTVSQLLAVLHNSIHNARCAELHQILRNNPDHPGLLDPQPSGDSIRLISSLFHNLQNSLPRLLSYIGLSVQDIGNSSR